LYYKSGAQLSYIWEGLKHITGFSGNGVVLWNDEYGRLKTILENGKIYYLSNKTGGFLEYDKAFGMKVTTWSNTIPFEFRALRKQFLLFTDAATGATHLYDLVKAQSAIDLTEPNTVFTTYGSAVHDQTIFLFQSNSATRRLVKIDVTNLKVEKVDVDIASYEYRKLYTLTPDLSLIETCESNTNCSLKTIDASGKVADLSGEPIWGKVVKL
jgi:hypothetical protein